MPVYKDEKRKTWYVKYSSKDPVTGERKQILKRGFQTKREATQWEADQIANQAKHTTQTFRDLMLECLKSLDSSQTSYEMKTHWIENHFPYIDLQIEKITRPMMVKWRNDLKDSKLATRTINRGIQYVKSVFSYAEKIYGLSNPSVVISTLKLTKEDKEEMPVLTEEQFDQAMQHLDLEVYKCFYTFLFWTGCRRGEALALCKEDISEDGYVHIYRAIKHYKNGFLPLKTDSSERTIKLDSKTFEMIKPLIEQANPFVFGKDRSLPITMVDKYFHQATDAAGVPRIRIHDLRHSHATWLINHNVNIVAISKRLGHASINQTLKTYSHLLDQTNDEMMDIIEYHKSKKE